MLSRFFHASFAFLSPLDACFPVNPVNDINDEKRRGNKAIDAYVRTQYNHAYTGKDQSD